MTEEIVHEFVEKITMPIYSANRMLGTFAAFKMTLKIAIRLEVEAALGKALICTSY